jgi:Zn-dependent protease with chaperone function
MICRLFFALLISFASSTTQSCDLASNHPEGSGSSTQTNGTFTYREELQAFKDNPNYKEIFDKDYPNPNMQLFRRDIENFKHLTSLQQLASFIFVALNGIVVSPKTMPKLYAYVESISQKAHIPMPIIFITIDDGFFNAAAQKFFATSGGIIIGQKLMNELSDEALEGVVAHEIGHIKHNHVNKGLALWLVSCCIAAKTLSYTNLHSLIKVILCLKSASLTSQLVIGKKFEREADTFAYKAINKGKGLKQAFELFQTKTDAYDATYDETLAALEANKNEMTLENYLGLKYNFCILKFFHAIDKGYRWLYHNTRYGPHPSNEDRIATIDAHLNNHAVDTQDK